MGDPSTTSQSASVRVLVVLASFVVVVAGMKAASPILVPFFLSVFIAIICTPPMFYMQRLGIPAGIAVVVMVLIIIIIGSLLGMVIGSSVNDFAANIPQYQEKLTIHTKNLVNSMPQSLLAYMEDKDIKVDKTAIIERFNPGSFMQVLANMLSGVTGVLTNAFLILLTVVFILLEASSLPAKLNNALDEPEKSLASFSAFADSVNRYLAIKTLFSAITGVAIGLWLSLLGVDYPILWGLFAFLLNFIPNIGSIIAAFPTVLLAIIQFGPGKALLTALGYLVVNVVVGSFVEPRFMGRDLGLSTLVVFLSLVFWGWVFGPVGMLLSVPLTMILKIALESNEDTRWMAILLGLDKKATSEKG